MQSAFDGKEEDQGLQKIDVKEEDQGLQKRLQRDEAEYSKHGGKFKQFDVIMNDDVMDFVFDAGLKEDFRTKKIMEEWRMLKEGLPHNIFVRAHKGDNNLLRAVIVGKKDTPYHDGLFFFDIEFPSSYPNEPPIVTYKSCGFRLHPNVEESDGKVCLSLLNTSRKNDKKEKWNSDLSKSNVLGVLKCIQERILDSKPYYDKHEKGGILPEWYLKRRSRSYNNETFVLNCKTMLKVLHEPPKDFEFFVAQHFLKHAEHILLECLRYIKGEKVGDLPVEDDSPPSSPATSSTPSSPPRDASKKYGAAMDELFPELCRAFWKNGSTNLVDHFNITFMLEEKDSKGKKKDLKAKKN